MEFRALQWGRPTGSAARAESGSAENSGPFGNRGPVSGFAKDGCARLRFFLRLERPVGRSCSRRLDVVRKSQGDLPAGAAHVLCAQAVKLFVLVRLARDVLTRVESDSDVEPHQPHDLE